VAEQHHDNFRDMERANRRATAKLVIVFILINSAGGFGLDFLTHLFVAPVLALHGIRIGFPIFMPLAALLASAHALRAYFSGSSVLLDLVCAKELSGDSPKNQTVIDVVTEIALASRIPRPRVCVMDDPAPNAFASGRDPEHSTICVTQGLIDQLDREELQAVIAHEIAHIRGHDTRLMQMALVMVGSAGLFQPGGPLSARSGGGAGQPPPLDLRAILSRGAMISMSRQREYLADAAAVEFTRNPIGLIRALEHIARIESPLKYQLRAVAPMFIVDPAECGGSNWSDLLDGVTKIESQADKSKEARDAEVAQFMIHGMPQSTNVFQGLFSSHPPIRERIVRLSALAANPADASAETTSDLQTHRQAAAKVVAEISKNNPDVVAAVLGSVLKSNPMAQALGSLGQGAQDDTTLQGAAPSETGCGDSDEDTYKKLYNYNLSLTGDGPRNLPDPTGNPLTPLQQMLRGAPANFDPNQLRTMIAVAMASQHKPRVVVTVKQSSSSTSMMVLFWAVIAISAGAIVAAMAVK
jgi:heat shock protein HtpX